MAHTSFLCSSADVPPSWDQHPHEHGLARNTALSTSVRDSRFCFSANVHPGPLGQGPWHVPVPPPATQWVAGPVSLGRCCSGFPRPCRLFSFLAHSEVSTFEGIFLTSRTQSQEGLSLSAWLGRWDPQSHPQGGPRCRGRLKNCLSPVPGPRPKTRPGTSLSSGH